MPNEICILCGKETNVDINTHVDYRYGYVEGAGQCCKECYNKTSNIEEDYVTRTMKNRTTLLTISAEDILGTPNDMQLGAKVRQQYWDTYGKPEKEPNPWVCGLCGKDTSNVDYDYLMGVDHIECHLKEEMKNDPSWNVN